MSVAWIDYRKTYDPPTMNNISKVKLATLVEGDPKTPFSIATTLRCKGRRYSIAWIAPLYLWYAPYNAECKTRWHQVPFFESLVWLDLGLKPGLTENWRTLFIRPMFTISKQVVTFLTKAMKNWTVKLSPEAQTIEEKKSKEASSRKIPGHHNNLL